MTIVTDHESNPVEDLALQVFTARAHPSSEALDEKLWATFRSTGLDQALCSDEPTSLRDGVLALRAAGKAAARIPAAEAMLSRWLAQQAGWEEEDGSLSTVMTAADGWHRVPWGRAASTVYAVDQGVVVRHHGPFELIRPGVNVAAEPRDEIVPPAREPERSGAVLSSHALLARSALLQAAMMAGAMNEALGVCVQHARERVQFGRPIAQFQAVQQMIAQLAAHAAAASAAVDLAAAEGSVLTAAIAKSRASEAVGIVTDAAHQVTGAMGFTVEFPLQQLSRRLWAWREENGNEIFWNKLIGETIAARAQAGLWPIVSSGEALREALPG